MAAVFVAKKESPERSSWHGCCIQMQSEIFNMQLPETSEPVVKKDGEKLPANGFPA